ncbi:unnamed protein product [Laminaria digitata]
MVWLSCPGVCCWRMDTRGWCRVVWLLRFPRSTWILESRKSIVSRKINFLESIFSGEYYSWKIIFLPKYIFLETGLRRRMWQAERESGGDDTTAKHIPHQFQYFVCL